ncbi:enterochelin esterase-like enzyme [Parabacteroides sp. PF5-5]|uniref:alpha/beta hydrolase-fold protein n=1 Tax=unclassified Parabacteroides TaxID=2649774 RepID=UPI002475A1DF|nr:MULTISPECIES: alpha/beta hydrolase-fold protein [unclassified Parabacteroides]MDH6304689.1 enterochelin esterase-like enzyme [Parabacteroides sp. PH5-39]MDH6315697.1 enterochelin esterase-like enzyme [Parabacteroides sp. PF5-13]MDH6319357.1 enterochelin esterase-like enzyme [Parabacteroides sp. PH5-13]MDH6323088.1 enterochelin esterase-like enzyme [Parabacteroides sp. PH5-8]MDH6326890.1 enterochelin esterase-like enzyme [Parabacteroides sp. PH5-41]
MKTFIIHLILMGMVSIAYAQSMKPADTDLPGNRSALNVRRAEYPRILPDNRAEFKVKAPEAAKVQIDLGRKYDMIKNKEGEWSCTTDPLGPGFHYYFLIVDGVSIADPASESFFGCGMMASGIEIPYPEGTKQFYLSDVPHGDIRMKRYYSTTAKDWRRMFVYTPPCYEKSNTTYPVLYLLHGGGEDERGWSQQGLTDIIMDNLIAKGEALPMVIVMTDGNSADFTSELLNDCIPFVEKNFRVKTEREHRALAGLSMGGIQTLNAGITHPELFSYLGVFSSGWWATPPQGFRNTDDTEKYYSLLKEKKELYNHNFKKFWISMGGQEDIAYNNCQIMMKRFDEIGIAYTYYETPGGHTWPVWRESLYRFAPLLFK